MELEFPKLIAEIEVDSNRVFEQSYIERSSAHLKFVYLLTDDLQGRVSSFRNEKLFALTKIL